MGALPSSIQIYSEDELYTYIKTKKVLQSSLNVKGLQHKEVVQVTDY